MAAIVNITERMLPDARNIYTIGDDNEILELASRLREGAPPLPKSHFTRNRCACVWSCTLLLTASNVDTDLKQLRRVVEDARDAVASRQHQDGGPPKPDVPTLPSMNPQAVRTLFSFATSPSARGGIAYTPASTSYSFPGLHDSCFLSSHSIYISTYIVGRYEW